MITNIPTLKSILKKNRSAVVLLSGNIDVNKDGKIQKQFICVDANFINLSKDRANPMRNYTLLYISGKFRAIKRTELNVMSDRIAANESFITINVSYGEDGKTISSEHLKTRIMGGQVESDVIARAIGLGYKLAK